MIDLIIEHPVISAIILYVFICWLIACAYVLEQGAWESATWDVPRGDLEYYGASPKAKFLNSATYIRILTYIIFFPTVIFVVLWMLFVSIVNDFL